MKDLADFQKPRSEIDLAAIREQGQKFLDFKVGDERKVREGLALLAQVVGKEKGGPLPDLAKLNDIQPKLVADDLLVWVVVGLAILLALSCMAALPMCRGGWCFPMVVRCRVIPRPKSGAGDRHLSQIWHLVRGSANGSPNRNLCRSQTLAQNLH
jgi:hypothetical protein